MNRTTIPAPAQLASLVREVAASDPTRAALIEVRRRPGGRLRSRTTSYAELSVRAARLSAGLARIGVGPATRCSFMVPPSAEAVALGLALFDRGATVVGIEPVSHGMRRVSSCLAQVEPEVFLGTPRAHLARRLFGWGRDSVHTEVLVGRVGPLRAHRIERLADGTAADPSPAEVVPEDPAIIAFTTGSTGTPKPTVLDWHGFGALLDLFRAHWTIGDEAPVVDMPTFPMFWIIGIAHGGTVVVPPMDFTLRGPGAADPDALLRTIQEHGVTSMFGSPALLDRLATYAATSGQQAPSLRRVVAGGAEVPGPLMAKVTQMLTDEGEVYADYGATEALPLTEITGREVLAETWSRTEQGAGICVGRPVVGAEVRVIAPVDGPIDDIGTTSALPPETIGELIGRGPHVSTRYADDEAATAANKIPDPTGVWHRPGDAAYLDAEGRVWVCGRRSHLVVTPQAELHPLRCEPVAAAHPEVRRAALIGPTREGRIVPTVCIEPVRRPRDPDRLRDEVLASLQRTEAGQHVERVVIVDAVPVDRRHNAKIDRPALTAEHSEEGA